MPELIHKENFVFDRVAKGNPTMRIMDFLIQNKENDFTITEIAEGSDVGRTTIWNGLLEYLLNEGLIIKTRTVGNAKMYRLNIKDEKVRALISLHNSLKEHQNV